MTASLAPAPLVVGGIEVPPGTERTIELPMSRLPVGPAVSLPVHVINGARPGPRAWLVGAIHGDELNGIETIAEVLDILTPQVLRGALVAVPVVNIFGVLHESRTLPDRRDLNRCFPGSPQGSMASRLAHKLMTEVVAHCSFGVDLHTAAVNRANLPQVRANLDDPEVLEMALAFGAPVALHAKVRAGSLRGEASKRGCKVLVYEAGEAQRFNRDAVETGVRGVLALLTARGMLDASPTTETLPPTVVSRKASWVRTPRAGLIRLKVELGDVVTKATVLARVGDAFGGVRAILRSRVAGVVIGVARNPLVHRGEAVVNIASTQTEVEAG